MHVITQQKCDYEGNVSEAIDTVLRKVFGDETALCIYKHLENSYSLRRDEIGEKIDVFAEGLEEFLMLRRLFKLRLKSSTGS